MNSRKLKRVILGLFLAFIACCIVVAGLFVSDSFVYNPDSVAVSCMESNSRVKIRFGGGYRVFEPESPIAEIIFYPASYVEFRAYAPLMQELASRGILSVACKMPGDLVFLGKNRADLVVGLYPEIEKTYMMGHGRGGTSASDYAAEYSDNFDGVILLAAKPSKKLADTDLSCLSIWGDCDGKMSEKDFEKCRKYYPADTEEFIIEGANHSQFGSFGTFSGDEAAEISAEEQLKITADKIAEFIKEDIGINTSEITVADETFSEEMTTEETTTEEETTVEETTEEENTVEEITEEESTKKSTKKASKKNEEETTTKKATKKSSTKTSKKTSKK